MLSTGGTTGVERLVWITDPHLNHVPLPNWERWIARVAEIGADALLVTGDISEGADVAFQLKRLVEAIDRPVYFVLGNHDYYGGTVSDVRQRLTATCEEQPALHYLTTLGPARLSESVTLVGVDGWGDAALGDYDRSPVRLNDFSQIEDFRVLSSPALRRRLWQLGRDSARRLARTLGALPPTCRRVIVATHVPPFREACWYQGRTTDEMWAPFFVCHAVGRVLKAAAARHPDRRFLVLCGHTHHAGMARMSDNLAVLTGASDYGWPDVARTLHVGAIEDEWPPVD